MGSTSRSWTSYIQTSMLGRHLQVPGMWESFRTSFYIFWTPQDLHLAWAIPLSVSVAETTAPLSVVRAPHHVAVTPVYSGKAHLHPPSYILEGIMRDMNPLGILTSYLKMVLVWIWPSTCQKDLSWNLLQFSRGFCIPWAVLTLHEIAEMDFSSLQITQPWNCLSHPDLLCALKKALF